MTDHYTIPGLNRTDSMPIAVISLILAFLATIYPSWRARRVSPDQALRYE